MACEICYDANTGVCIFDRFELDCHACGCFASIGIQQKRRSYRVIITDNASIALIIEEERERSRPRSRPYESVATRFLF
jgi:hypothetical protein